MRARRSSESDWRLVVLDRGDAGVRLDRVLLRHLQPERGMSRTRIQRGIASGDVLVNGAPAPRAAWRVAPGDELRVRFARVSARPRPSPEPIPLQILYEDDHLLAVAKPAGLVAHPSYKNAAGTLLNGVLQHAQSWPAGSKPSLVGRLDKHTSGVVLIAKSAAVHLAMQRAMDARQVDKDYLAVVWGKPSPPRGAIDLALDRDPWDRRRVTVTDRGGQPSVTLYQRLAVSPRRPETGARCSLVQCRLVTGRTHQIRVHLAAKGWPIVGDQVYGRRPLRGAADADVEVARRIDRQALHAWRLRLPHPVTGRPLVIVAPLPGDMQALCASLRLTPPSNDRGSTSACSTSA